MKEEQSYICIIADDDGKALDVSYNGTDEEMEKMTAYFLTILYEKSGRKRKKIDSILRLFCEFAKDTDNILEIKR